MESRNRFGPNMKEYGDHVIGLFVFIILPFVYFHSTQDPEQMPRLTALSAFLLLGSVLFLIGKKEVRMGKAFFNLTWILLAMLAWTGFSMVFSINTGDAFSEWLRLAVLFAFLFYANLLISKSPLKMMKWLAIYAAIGIHVFSAFAIVQVIDGLKNYNGLGYSLANTICSLFANKNFFSECLALMIPFLVYGFRTNRLRGIYISALILDLLFIIILKSSATWAAVLAATMVYFLLVAGKKFSRRKIILFLSLICVLGASLIFLTRDKFALTKKISFAIEYLRNPDLISVTREENNNSTYERMMLWRNTLTMIRDHPAMGVGLNNWKIFNPSYGIGGTQFTNTGMIVYEHPHNDYLLVLAEQGPVGIILYLFFLGFVFVTGIKIFRQANADQKYFIALLISAIVAFAVISVFSYPRSRVYQMVLFMLIIASLFSFSNKESKVFNNFTLLLIIVISLSGVYVFNSRTLSEIHTRNMILAQVHKNFPRMQREAVEADTWLYPIDMSSTPIHWYKGMSKFYENDIEGAMKEYEKSILINPFHLRTINDLATTYEKSGRRQEAIDLYRRGLKISPYFIEGNLNLSAAYYNSGNIDSAYYFINSIKDLKKNMLEENNYRIFSKVIKETRDSLNHSK